MSDLPIMFPKAEVVRLNGKPVFIRPIELRDFEAFGVAAGGLISLLADASPAKVYAFAKETGALRAILGKATSLSRWRIRRLPVAVAVQLMVHVVRVNSGFFDAALQAMASQVAGLTQPSS